MRVIHAYQKKPQVRTAVFHDRRLPLRNYRPIVFDKGNFTREAGVTVRRCCILMTNTTSTEEDRQHSRYSRRYHGPRGVSETRLATDEQTCLICADTPRLDETLGEVIHETFNEIFVANPCGEDSEQRYGRETRLKVAVE